MKERKNLLHRIYVSSAFSVPMTLSADRKYWSCQDIKKFTTSMPTRFYNPVNAFFLAECCSNSTSFIKAHASMTFGFDTR